MLRVTDQTMTLAAQRALGARQARLAAAQGTASSGTRLARPSDDPVGTSEALRVRAQMAATAQYSRNVTDGTAWLTAVDSALGSATDLLRRARDTAIQGINGSLNQDGRNALAAQVDALRKELMTAANTRYLGRSVFAGTSDAVSAFTDGTPPTFNGIPGGTVQRRIGPDQTVRVDADGAAAFGTGPGSVFSVLDGIAADLRSGADPSSRLTALDAGMNAISAARTDAGGRLNALTRASQAASDAAGSLEARRSGIEDMDLGKAVLDLQLQQTAYQAALAVAAKVLQPSLTDFLR